MIRSYILVEPFIGMVNGWYIEKALAQETLERHNEKEGEQWFLLEHKGSKAFPLIKGTAFGDMWHVKRRCEI